MYTTTPQAYTLGQRTINKHLCGELQSFACIFKELNGDAAVNTKSQELQIHGCSMNHGSIMEE